MADRSKAAGLERKLPRKEEASEDQKAREPCLSHRGGDIWLKPKEEIKGCVEGIGPTDPYSACTVLWLLQGI